MPRDWRISPHSETVFTSRWMECGRWACGAPARRGWVVSNCGGRRSRPNGAHVGRPRSACPHLSPASTPSVMRRCGPRGTGSRRCSPAGRGGALARLGGCSLGDQAKRGGRHRLTAPVRTGRGRKRPGCEFIAARGCGSDEMTVERGVPCTTVARTLLDLAGVLRGRGLDAAIETSERLGLLDLNAVGILLGRHRRRGAAPGGCAGRSPAFDPELVRARSETEARFYCLCVDAGLPRPLVNRLVGQGERSRTRPISTGPPPG